MAVIWIDRTVVVLLVFRDSDHRHLGRKPQRSSCYLSLFANNLGLGSLVCKTEREQVFIQLPVLTGQLLWTCLPFPDCPVALNPKHCWVLGQEKHILLIVLSPVKYLKITMNFSLRTRKQRHETFPFALTSQNLVTYSYGLTDWILIFFKKVFITLLLSCLPPSHSQLPFLEPLPCIPQLSSWWLILILLLWLCVIHTHIHTHICTTCWICSCCLHEHEQSLRRLTPRRGYPWEEIPRRP